MLGVTEERKPMVSIVIPTYNRVNTLKNAVTTALKQEDFFDYEIVVVDNDNSENNDVLQFLEGIKSDRISYYKNEENIGMVGNWNRGVFLSQGKWVTILCDDDLLHPKFLKIMMGIIDKNINLNFLLSRYQLFSHAADLIQKSDEIDVAIETLCHSVNKYELLFGNVNCCIGALLKKENVLKIGGFSDELYPSYDHAFTKLYISEFGGGMVVEKKLAYYNKSLNTSSDQNVRLKSIEKDHLISKSFIKKEFNNSLIIKRMHETLLMNYFKQIIVDGKMKDELRMHVFKGKQYPSILKVKIINKIASFLMEPFAKNRSVF